MIIAILILLALCGLVCFAIWQKNKSKAVLKSKSAPLPLEKPEEPVKELPRVEDKVLQEITQIIPPSVQEEVVQKPVEKAVELPIIKEPAPVEEPKKEALTEALNKTKNGFMAKLQAFFKRGSQKLSDEDLEEIEAILYGADLGVKTVDKLLLALKEKLSEGKTWQEVLKEEMKQILHGHDKGELQTPAVKPQVMLFVGVNGAGKTTSIGKLGKRFLDQGQKVIFGAGDTFRAAAVTQLQVWAERVNAGFVAGKEKSDSASVLFETIQRGKNEGFDVVLCDTAGRLHTKTELMDELKKVYRVAEKSLGRQPDEVLLVIDATMGQNALVQAREFSESAPISGVVLSKVDGTAKGGIALAIVEELKIPIRYIGVGEKDTDLKAFNADEFVEALFL